MTKPFNLADAKAGHPVCNAHLPVQIYDFDFRSAGLPLPYILGAVVAPDSTREIKYWDPDGKYGGFEGSESLLMAPLGQVDGRDVYPGDMLCFNGEVASSPVPYGVPFHANEWAWPQTYPTTQMSIQLVAFESPEPHPENLKAVANAALVHGIDNGYLYDAKEIDPLFNRLYSYLGHNGSLTFAEQVDRLTGMLEAFRGVLKDVAERVGMDQGLIWDALPGCVEKLVTERDELLKMNSNQAGEIVQLRERVAERDKVLGEIHRVIGAGPRWALQDLPQAVQRLAKQKSDQAAMLRAKHNATFAELRHFYHLGNTEMDHAGVISDGRILAELKRVPR